MDDSGNNEIDLNEYVMFMIRNSGELDPDTIRAYESQFHALDASGDGTLGMDDFPEGMALKKTIR
jgi:hypothetical protein